MNENKQDTLKETRSDILKMLATQNPDRLWRMNLTCSLWMVNRLIEGRKLMNRVRDTLYAIRAENRGYNNNSKER